MGASTKPEACEVLIEGVPYNLTPFLDAHPGGSKLLRALAGRDVTTLMNEKHNHFAAAYAMLPEMRVGVETLAPPDPDLTAFRNELPTFTAMTVETNAQEDLHKHHFMDLGEPLMPQIWASHWTKEFYLDQVHRPRHCASGARIYANPILDTLLTKTPWWLLLVYAPVSYLTYGSRGLFVAGLPLWTLVEYLLHRFLFHIDNLLPDYSPRAFAFHFTMHGRHHFLPMDVYRVSASPHRVALIAFVFWLFLKGLFGDAGTSIFSGALFGFMLYEEFHLSLHTMPEFYQFWSSTSYYLEMKRYHLQHHYKNYELGYGVTSKVWDFVFNTVLDPNDETQVHAKRT